jgi:menaquinone-9 beta-reductase
MVAYYDLLILGGGPAGLSTALHLTKLAPHLAERTLLLEQAHYPRPKLCAGGLTVDAEVLLERLGLDLDEVPHALAGRIYFAFEGEGFSVRLPGRHALRTVRREEFDAWLAEKARAAGVEIRQGVQVQQVIPAREGVIVETDAGRLRARMVVGADGSNGVTRLAVLSGRPARSARTLELLTPGPPDDPHRETALFDFQPIPHGLAGYVWDFPALVQGRPARCRGIYDANLATSSLRAPLKSALAGEMKRLGLDLEQYPLAGFPIRRFSPCEPISVPGVILAGDAAGSDPLLGEGVSLALGYGRVAAEAVRDAFQWEDFTFADYRRRVLLNPLGQSLTARWALSQVLYRLRWSGFQRLLWGRLGVVIRLAGLLLVVNWARRQGRLQVG